MSDKSGKKKRGPARRTERRFIAEASYASRMSTGVGMIGSLLLGAGVWSSWIVDEPKAYAMYLVLVGAACLVGSLWWSSRGPAPIRVGDLGVAFEQKGDLQRSAWYEIETISMQGDSLVLQLAGRQISIPLDAHPKAIAKIVQEAAVRIPSRLDLSPSQHQALPKLSERDGEQLPAGPIQITGQKCLHCEQPITFERDARLCPACGAIYNNSHVPGECKACGGALGQRAVTV
jgi:hypothetical protein